MDITKLFANCFIFLILLISHPILAENLIPLERLQEAYPDSIQAISKKRIAWKDGTYMRLNESNSFFDKLHNLFKKNAESNIMIQDLQCHGAEPFLKKLYGSTEVDVRKNLVVVYWMPHVFGNQYPLKVTRINHIDKKIRRISAELEKLPASYYPFLDRPAGSFYWRKVKHEKYLSSHSFGIAIDINSKHANYWMWDWEKAGKPRTQLALHNSVPMKIIHIFEKEGFLWGGRWYFYDTMHFEYRPELFLKTAKSELEYNNLLDTHCYG